MWHLRVFQGAYDTIIPPIDSHFNSENADEPLDVRPICRRRFLYPSTGSSIGPDIRPAGHVYPAPYSQSSPVWCVDHLTLRAGTIPQVLAMGVWSAFGCHTCLFLDTLIPMLLDEITTFNATVFVGQNPNFYFSKSSVVQGPVELPTFFLSQKALPSSISGSGFGNVDDPFSDNSTWGLMIIQFIPSKLRFERLLNIPICHFVECTYTYIQCK